MLAVFQNLRWNNKGRVEKNKKKLCKITRFGGWVGQEWENLQKNAFKIHFRPF